MPDVFTQAKRSDVMARIRSRGNCGWQGGRGCGSFPRVPRKIRQLVADLEQAGFGLVPGGKGSHRKFRHPKFPGFVLISGHSGDDAQHYQEKQLRNALRRIRS